MSVAPVYMSACGIFRAQVTVANLNRDGTGTLVTPTWTWTGGTAAPTTDWMLKRIKVYQGGGSGAPGDLADSVLTMFVTDGSTITPFDDIDLGNPTANSVGSTGLLFEVPYVEHQFPGGVDLRFAITTAPTAGFCQVTGWCEKT